MKACGIEDQKNCAVSGHKNPASLQSYDRVTDADSVRMSTAIDTLSNSDTAESKENLPAVSEVSGPSHKEVNLTDQYHPKPVASSAACAASPIPDGVVLQSCSNITINVSPISITPRKRRFPWSLSRKENKELRAAREAATDDKEN